MACNVAFCLQCQPLRGGVVIDLDAEGDRWREEADGWREEADGWRGRRERRGQRGDGQQAASQLAPTECEVSDRHLGVVTGGCMSGHLYGSCVIIQARFTYLGFPISYERTK